MSKTMSHFAYLANLSNSLKSTGPRTDPGKAVSRMNAVKHGCRATEPLIDENPEEIKAARDRWVQDAKPQGEVATSVVDLTFRLYRQVERSLAADDSALNLRIEEARDSILTERTQFIREAIELFEADPGAGYPRLRVTGDGVEILLLKLDQLDETLELAHWGVLDSAQLAAMEGLAEPDETLCLAVTCFDHARSAARMVQRTQGAGEAQIRLDHDRALLEYRKFAAEIEKLTPLLQERILHVRHRLQEERITAKIEEAVVIRRTIDLVKFDDSPEGKLRRRYIADSQRDFFRSYKEMMKICKPAGAKPEVVKPAELPKAAQSAWTGSPNEAMMDDDDEDDFVDHSASPTDVPGRKSA